MITRRHLTAGLLAAPALLRIPRARAADAKVRIGTILGAPNMASFMLPDYLKKAGIDAEVIVFANIVQRMQAVAAGDVQIGYGGINAAIGLAARGTALTLLANATGGGWNMLGGPNVKSFADLKGRKVAVQTASISHICLQWKLKHEGIFDDVDVLGMDNSAMPAAVERGDVDASIPFEPFASFIVLHKWAQPIWTPYDTPMGRLNLGVIATPEFIARNPALTQAILTAHREATADLARDPAAAADAIVKTLNMPHDVAVESLKNTFYTTAAGPEFVTQVKALGQMMLDAKMTQKLPDWHEFIDPGLSAA